jgi:hypothetical protein
MRKSVRIVASGLLVLLSAAIALGLGEAYLWLDDNFGRAPDGHADVTWNGRRYALNEAPEPAARAEQTWLVIGDSFVVGRACGRERNLTGHLRLLAGSAEQPLSVINLGQPARSGPSHAQIFADYIAEFGPPQRATVVLYANDPDFDIGICDDLAAYADLIDRHPAEGTGLREACARVHDQTYETRFVDRLMQTFYTAKLGREAVMRLLLLTGAEVPLGRVRHLTDWERPDSLYRQILFASLDRIGTTARQQGVVLDVVLFPPVDDLSFDSPYFGVYERVAGELSRRLGVPAASGFAAFPLVPGKKLSYVWSMTDHHPSCEGHALMARWIWDRGMPARSDP